MTQARDLKPGHVIHVDGRELTVKSVEYSPGSGGRVYVEFEGGAVRKVRASARFTVQP